MNDVEREELQPLRVQAVSFLNARPLLHSLTGERAPRLPDGRLMFELHEALPSACSDALANGEADLALLPVATLIDHPEWEVVPDIGIGCQGAVETVVLATAVPIEQIEHVWLDSASRSSVLLLKILLAQKGLCPSFEAAPHGEGEARVEGTTASLIIGDAAFGLAERLAEVSPGARVIDLGSWWQRETGLPFVFALWAAPPGVLRPEHVSALQAARDRSLGKFAEAIARDYREELLALGRTALSENHYANYLRRRIRYGLETHQREGLVDFLARAREMGLVQVPGLADDEDIHVHFAGAKLPEVLTRARVARSSPMDLEALLEKGATGQRLSLAEGIFLHDNADLMALGEAADRRRRALHPEAVVTYIIDRNVNYTNVCVTRCKFCNFYKPTTAKEGKYVLSRQQLAEKFRETVELGGVQILLQGGLNPELRIAWYEDFFRWAKAEFPGLHMHALSPTEVIHIAQLEEMSVREVLVRLQAAGMDSLPGGGAEILDDEIRNRISPFKNTALEWLGVMREAHSLGMKTSATMVFGFQETTEHRLLHMERLRGLQDETGGFTAFITWPFQADGTRLKLRDDTSAMAYLRVQSVARLYLDNIPNIQVSWPTLGAEIGEIALRFGANDFGSVMIEENVVSQAGADFMMTAEQIESHIRLAGFTPHRRNQRYDLLGAAE
jgi:cyclic dehypoxanthinyl futalosine synthase